MKKQFFNIFHENSKNFQDPWVGTDTPGPGEAVFAIRFDGKPEFQRKIREKLPQKSFKVIHIWILKMLVFDCRFGFPMNLTAETASPGPGVSVPSLGSLKIWQN